MFHCTNIPHFTHHFIWIVSAWGLQCITALWAFLHKFSSGRVLSFLLGVCLGVELLGLTLTLCHTVFWSGYTILHSHPEVCIWSSRESHVRLGGRGLLDLQDSVLLQASHFAPLCCFPAAQLGVARCQGKCQKSSPDAGRQPLSGKSFYLDLPAGKNLQFLTGAIQQLGGVCSLPLSFGTMCLCGS